MTKPKFKVGDRVGTKDGRTWKVKQVNTESGALLLETEKDVKPYETTWFAGTTVKAARSGRAGQRPADSAKYVVKLRATGDESAEPRVFEIVAPDEDAATVAAFAELRAGGVTEPHERVEINVTPAAS